MTWRIGVETGSSACGLMEDKERPQLLVLKIKIEKGNKSIKFFQDQSEKHVEDERMKWTKERTYLICSLTNTDLPKESLLQHPEAQN